MQQAKRKVKSGQEIGGTGKVFVFFSNRLGCAGSLRLLWSFGTVVLANARVRRSAKRLLTLRQSSGRH